MNLIGQTQTQLHGGPWDITVIRNGYVACEWLGVPATAATSFHVWSCTKSVTAMAFGMLFEESRRGTLPGGCQIDLESAAYDFIPEGHPLSDVRKSEIKIRHLLSMTSGIAGEAQGFLVMPVAPGHGEFELALGRDESRFGVSSAALAAGPGELWNYSDLGFAHLSLIFSRVTGREIADYVNERIFRPVGIESFGWDRYGGSGHIGPHTSTGIGLHLTARDLARLGYLMGRRGRWQETQLVPAWWADEATRRSQDLNRSYGYGFWVNTDGLQWPGLPRDTFAFMGYGANRCYVVPSLDLVVVRVGGAPPNWGEDSLLPGIVGAIDSLDGH